MTDESLWRETLYLLWELESKLGIIWFKMGQLTRNYEELQKQCEKNVSEGFVDMNKNIDIYLDSIDLIQKEIFDQWQKYIKMIPCSYDLDKRLEFVADGMREKYKLNFDLPVMVKLRDSDKSFELTTNEKKEE